MRLVMPVLYVILDAGMLTEPAGDTAKKLIAAGVRLLQYRNKKAGARELLDESRGIAGIARETGCYFFVNDRPDVAYLVGASGVHVGQEDLGAEQARALVGPEQWVGVSTHSLKQFEEAAATSADYIAVGPVFPTVTKQNPDPVIGIEFLRAARKITWKPLVAIGGITVQSAGEVFRAGADSVAVISDLALAPDPAERAREYLAIARQVSATRSPAH